MKAIPYCTCKFQSDEKANRHIDFHETKVDSEGVCSFCGHYATFSKNGKPSMRVGSWYKIDEELDDEEDYIVHLGGTIA